jgi:hypothetical protein
MKGKFIYKFEKSPAKKGQCPNCKYKNCFRYYIGLDREFGICERINSCGYFKRPNMSSGNGQPVNTKVIEPLIKYLEKEYCQLLIDDQSSNFHKFCQHDNLKIPKTHLEKWNIGSLYNERSKIVETVYIYQNHSKYLNVRHFEYSIEGKRNKSKNPYSLKAPGKNLKYSFCLFGEHLLTSEKIICIVESEKTAVIASYFYPQFDWLATGGKSGLTDEKIPILFNRIVYYLNDADEAGKKNSTIKKLTAHEINFKIIDLFPNRNDGYDIADAIMDGIRPEIKPEIEYNSTEYLPGPVKKTPFKKISNFEKVENYLQKLYDLRYNEISNLIECKKKDEKEFKSINPNSIYRLLQHNNIKFSQSDIAALLGSDFVPIYNPFKEYFERLPNWDMNTDENHIEKLSNYVQCKDQDRFRIQLMKMFVRCIACSLEDNVFNKHAFILVHDKQNSGKTTFLRWLCPPALEGYMTDTFIVGKDGEMSLSDNFIINLDELSTLSKQDINSLKSCFSRMNIRQRRPFGKVFTNLPRRANFVGSTNKSEFLSDETGSVRWLCFEIISIDWLYKINLDINLIWSQAYKLYKSGFKYELTSAEILENENVNKGFRILTPEIELIQKYFVPATMVDHDLFFTATDFSNHISERHRHVKLNSNNIGKALKILEFQRGQKNNGKHAIKGYYVKLIPE